MSNWGKRDSRAFYRRFLRMMLALFTAMSGDGSVYLHHGVPITDTSNITMETAFDIIRDVAIQLGFRFSFLKDNAYLHEYFDTPFSARRGGISNGPTDHRGSRTGEDFIALLYSLVDLTLHPISSDDVRRFIPSKNERGRNGYYVTPEGVAAFSLRNLPFIQDLLND